MIAEGLARLAGAASVEAGLDPESLIAAATKARSDVKSLADPRLVEARHGLDRCRYNGDTGIRRWVGLGVIGDNLVTIGNALAKTPDA